MNQLPSTRWRETTPLERDLLLRALTPEQSARLEAHEYVWLTGAGVLRKNQPDGALRRARLTHGTRFWTKCGVVYVASVRRTLGLRRGAPPAGVGLSEEPVRPLQLLRARGIAGPAKWASPVGRRDAVPCRFHREH